MIALLLSAVLGLLAQDAPPDAAALQAELDALQAEQEAYSDTFWASLPRTADGSLTMPEDREDELPNKVFGARFLELGRRAGATPAGAAALRRALGMVEDPDAKREAGELLLARFMDSPLLEEAATGMGWARLGLGTRPVEAWLRRIIEGSPHADVRAAAMLALAEALFQPGFAPGPDGQLTSDASPDPATARELLVALQERYPASKYAQESRGLLFELDHLQVGMVAPDVEATDQDGVAFKLSDYRGKVVLLVFWGFW
jgi:hypothetical protein